MLIYGLRSVSGMACASFSPYFVHLAQDCPELTQTALTIDRALTKSRSTTSAPEIGEYNLDPFATFTAARMNFTAFLVQIADALQNKKGQELAYLLSPREAHSKSVVKEFRNPTVSSKHMFCRSVTS